MKDFVSHLGNDVEKQFRLVENGESDIIRKSLIASQLYGDACGRLKEFIYSYEFKNEKEEIEFFKVVKPNFCKHLLYHRKVYNIEMNRPLSGKEEKVLYLKNELDSIQKYTIKRLDFYRYYRQGATHSDVFYFTRGKIDTEQYLESFSYERDPKFSTNADFKVTKILVNDMLQIYLMGEIELLEGSSKCNQDFLQKEKLTWKLSKAYLIELIYALDSIKAFGNDIKMTQLSSYLQKIFNINLGNNLSRTFAELKIRNKQTPFLEKLIGAIKKRMNNINKK